MNSESTLLFRVGASLIMLLAGGVLALFGGYVFIFLNPRTNVVDTIGVCLFIAGTFLFGLGICVGVSNTVKQFLCFAVIAIVTPVVGLAFLSMLFWLMRLATI